MESKNSLTASRDNIAESATMHSSNESEYTIREVIPCKVSVASDSIPSVSESEKALMAAFSGDNSEVENYSIKREVKLEFVDNDDVKPSISIDNFLPVVLKEETLEITDEFDFRDELKSDGDIYASTPYGISNNYEPDSKCGIVAKENTSYLNLVGVKEEVDNSPSTDRQQNNGSDQMEKNIRVAPSIARSSNPARSKCSQCSKIFKWEWQVTRHIKRHSEVRLFECGQCSKSFKTKGDLKSHMRVHSDVRLFECVHCHKKFKRERDVNEHMIVHSNVRRFKCDHCKKKFKLRGTIQKHMKTHSNVRPFDCTQCSRSFKIKKNLKSHMRTHSDVRLFICARCSKSFKSKMCLKAHIMSVHSDVRLFECGQCQKKFKSKRDLNVHMIVHSNVRRFECDHCKKTFKVKSTIQNHMETHADFGLFECGQCSKSFKLQRSLRSHLRVHSDLTLFECACCGVSFKRNCDMQRHMITHSNVRPFDCTQCSKSFKSKREIQQHMRTHSDVRLFNCAWCSKSFKAEVHLKSHNLRVHSEVRLFECFRCRKEFKSKYELEMHSRSSKQFGNFHCSQSFHGVGDLKKRSDKILYVCDQCGRKFTSLSGVEVHVKTHSNPILFECGHCKVMFENEIECVNHCKSHFSDGRFESERLRERVESNGEIPRTHVNDSMFERKQFLKSKREVRAQSRSNSDVGFIDGKEEPLDIIDECKVELNLDGDLYASTSDVVSSSFDQDSKCGILTKDLNPVCIEEEVNSFPSHDVQRDNGSDRLKEGMMAASRIERCVKHAGFRCRHCNICFKSAIRHMMSIHPDVELFECFKCQKRFIYKGELTKHMENHTDFEPVCTETDVNNFLSTDVQQYNRLMMNMMALYANHSGFRCSQCSKSFKTSNGMREHLNTHYRNYKRSKSFDSIQFDGNVDAERLVESNGNYVSPMHEREPGNRTQLSSKSDVNVIDSDLVGISSESDATFETQATSNVDDGLLECRKCNMTFKSPWGFRMHTMFPC